MSNTILYNQLLERVVGQNPEFAQYTELFSELMKDDGSSPATADKLPELENRVRKLTTVARRLKNENDDLLDDLDDLTKALGACDECWSPRLGVDNRCPTCRGKGIPGFYAPDRELFNKLILPALREASWLTIQEKR